MTIKNIHSIITNLHETMVELEALLNEELNQLKRPQINPVSLQLISDTKSRLLSKIKHYDEQRKTEEAFIAVKAPYRSHPLLAEQWQTVVKIVQESNRLHHEIAVHLEGHMIKNENLKKLFSQVSNNSLYHSDGQPESENKGKMYNITI